MEIAPGHSIHDALAEIHREGFYALQGNRC
jgi:hypothetical protein